jgi:aldehyde dehydrogenase (NAD+)
MDEQNSTVHDVETLAARPGFERRDGNAQHAGGGFRRVVADVRGGQDVREIEERIGPGRRLLVVDVERGAGDAALATFDNCGQVCSSSGRYLLHPKIRDEFLERVQDKAAKLSIGPGLDNPDLGPVVSQDQYDRVTDYIAQGLRAGARLRFGGQRPPHLQRGYFVTPTLFDQVDPAATVAREEIFGPVGVAIDVAGEDEALRIANGLGYGLAAGIYTRDISRALRLARELEAGSVWINGWWMGGVQAPTGGIKDSGIGRERGLAGIRNYLQVKNVAIRL